MMIVYRYRVKDKMARSLERQAKAVNLVWNFCNDTQRHALKWGKKWPTRFDLNNLTAGAGKELGLHSGTVNSVCEQYSRSRQQHRRPHLRYRGKKSLGWIPFRGRDIKQLPDGFRFAGLDHQVWMSRKIPAEAILKNGGSFSQDARGRWYINITVEVVSAEASDSGSAVGIDLGLKDLATLSTGEKIAAPKFYRRSQNRLGAAQRACKKRLAKQIQAKIANQRRDFLHKTSTSIVRQHHAIYVGNVNSSRLAKTSMAKSVLDAGWSSFRGMLAYKAIRHGVKYREVNEAYSTQACSECGCIGGPKGREGLVIRVWECSSCGVSHDRDINAARNLLRLGHQTP